MENRQAPQLVQLVRAIDPDTLLMIETNAWWAEQLRLLEDTYAYTVKQQDEPTMVAGDLNDVAWSYTTTLFQKTSSLLAPRVGRGMYNSYNAKNVFMRWPLDHVFHSNHFLLHDLRRLPAFGSDHFPIYIDLSLMPQAEALQDELPLLSQTGRPEALTPRHPCILSLTHRNLPVQTAPCRAAPCCELLRQAAAGGGGQRENAVSSSYPSSR